MEISTYVDNCKKLIDHFGAYKANKELLNEVWPKIKNEPDSFIINRVKYIIKTKSPYSDMLHVEDFIPRVININSKQKKSNFRHTGSLQRVLDSMGAANIIDAMNKVKQSRN